VFATIRRLFHRLGKNNHSVYVNRNSRSATRCRAGDHFDDGFHDPDSLALALKVVHWTIQNMQDRTGYFYYRRYSSWLVNKTPTLHWGQATMLCALAGLYKVLKTL
jgi:hypothetical protein